MRLPSLSARGARHPVLFAMALLAACAGVCGAAEAGQEAPKFANPDLKGNYLRHATVVGKRWVIVSFFATWCEPCKEELPSLEALQAEAGPEKLQIIVFATDKEKESVKGFFEQKPTNLTVLLDPYQVTYLRYNAQEDGLPTIFLVSPDGTIAMKHIGYSPEFIEELRQRVFGAR